MKLWKAIENFDNYEVSDIGEVRNKKTGRILKPKINRYGYFQVDLSVNGKVTQKTVHRLVAETFIQNPDNKPQVNHINEIKSDNCVDNLNWMTSKENANWGTRNERMKNNPNWKKNHNEQLKKAHESKENPIIVIYRDDTYEEYPSATIAAKELGLWQQNIVKVLKGRRKTTGNLRFEYTKDKPNNA